MFSSTFGQLKDGCWGLIAIEAEGQAASDLVPLQLAWNEIADEPSPDSNVIKDADLELGECGADKQDMVTHPGSIQWIVSKKSPPLIQHDSSVFGHKE